MKTNFKNMAWMLAATLVMAACSDSLDESSGNGNSNEYVGNKGYVNIGINLPTTPSTRANDQFDVGAETEYKVNEVIIALFYGATEEAATCQWAFKLDNTNFIPSGNSNDNITSYYTSGVRMIPAPTDNVYALAIVNPISKFGVSTATDADNEDAGDAVLSTYLTVDSGSGATKFGGTLSGLNTSIDMSAITDVIGTSYNDFMMTNAPIANNTTFKYTSSPKLDGDGAFQVTTLAPITVYNNKATAAGAYEDNPIYVERVVAKTQVKIGGSSTDGSLTVTSDVTAYQNATVKFNGWKLQNTNKKYYPVRKVTDATIDDWQEWAKLQPTTSIGTSTNRFFGTTTAKPHRTYWGIDPNYATNLGNDYNVLTTINDWNDIGYTNHESEIEYCLENTTTAQAMEDERLTSVLLKGTFTPNGAQSGDNFFMLNNTSAIYTETDFLKVATAALQGGNALADGASLQLKTNLTSGANITTKEEVLNLLEITGGTSAELTGNQAEAILNFSAIGGSIKYYQNGVTYYYATVIKHFGDVDTPLDNNSITSASDYTEANHLGRYGVLRNNWYELNVTKVTGPGEPEIPDGGGTNPPDKTASYINCEINVLSWAKRSQNVEL